MVDLQSEAGWGALLSLLLSLGLSIMCAHKKGNMQLLFH